MNLKSETNDLRLYYEKVIDSFISKVKTFNLFKYLESFNIDKDTYYGYLDSGVILNIRGVKNDIKVSNTSFSLIKNIISESSFASFSRYFSGDLDIEDLVKVYKDYEDYALKNRYAFFVYKDIIFSYSKSYLLTRYEFEYDVYCNCVYGYFNDIGNLSYSNDLSKDSRNIKIVSTGGDSELYKDTIVGIMMYKYMIDNSISFNGYLLNAFLSFYLYSVYGDKEKDDLCIPLVLINHEGKYYVYRDIDNFVIDITDYFARVLDFNSNSPLVPILSSKSEYFIDSFPEVFLSAKVGERVNTIESLFGFDMSNVSEV